MSENGPLLSGLVDPLADNLAGPYARYALKLFKPLLTRYRHVHFHLHKGVSQPMPSRPVSCLGVGERASTLSLRLKVERGQ